MNIIPILVIVMVALFVYLMGKYVDTKIADLREVNDTTEVNKLKAKDLPAFMWSTLIDSVIIIEDLKNSDLSLVKRTELRELLHTNCISMRIY